MLLTGFIVFPLSFYATCSLQGKRVAKRTNLVWFNVLQIYRVLEKSCATYF